MPTNVKYGYAGKIYLNSGTYGTPVWNEASAVQDVAVGADFSEVDATTRQGGGIAQAEPVLLSLSVGGKIRSDEGDTTGFLTMETAFLTRGILDVMALDNANTVTGARGYRFDAKNFKFGEAQGAGDLLFREFELKPCVSSNPAKKAVVASGAPVFTSL